MCAKSIELPTGSPVAKRVVAGVLLAISLVADARAQHSAGNPLSVRLEPVATGLVGTIEGTDQIFPTELVPFPDGSDRLLVGTLGGVLRLIDAAGSLAATPYHDTTSQLTINGDNGNASFGLTCVAFHPDFAASGAPGFGRFYTFEPEVSRLDPPPDFPGIGADQGGSNPAHDRVLYEYTVDDPSADVFIGNKREVLRIHEHRRGHDVDDLAFDDAGYLLISNGDTVVPNSAQDRTNVFGSILRLDPLAPEATPGSSDSVSANGRYRVPDDNPFVDDPLALDELFAFGLRNPYRISVDPRDGQLYVTSNGDSSRESVYAVDSGDNLGWPFFEGSLQRQTPPSGFVFRPPIFEYDHSLGLSINGVFVYRGSEVPSLFERLIFADFLGPGSGARVFHGDLGTGAFSDVVADTGGTPMPGTIVSVGEDADGELYLVSTDGSIVRLAASATGPDDEPPSMPTGLVATVISSTGVELTWQPSTDNVVVGGYRVLRDGTEIANVATTEIVDEGVNPETTYAYTVLAEDLAGNLSPASEPLEVTTPEIFVLFFEDFEGTGPGADPPGWRDTAAGNSMVEDPTLFGTVQVGGTIALGTASNRVNIHSHYDAEAARGWSNYRFSGRLLMSAADGGLGVTAYSQYREGGSDAYYRLRRYAGEPSFHLASHGTTLEGTLDTGFIPEPDTWVRFLLNLVTLGDRTQVRAKIWPEGDPEPADFQVDAFDDGAGRLTNGTVGFWTLGPGEKVLDNVEVGSISALFVDGFESGDTSGWTAGAR